MKEILPEGDSSNQQAFLLLKSQTLNTPLIDMLEARDHEAQLGYKMLNYPLSTLEAESNFTH